MSIQKEKTCIRIIQHSRSGQVRYLCHLHFVSHSEILTVFNPSQTGLFLLPGTGGGGGEDFGGPTAVTLQPLMVWLPNLHRTIY